MIWTLEVRLPDTPSSSNDFTVDKKGPSQFSVVGRRRLLVKVPVLDILRSTACCVCISSISEICSAHNGKSSKKLSPQDWPRIDQVYPAEKIEDWVLRKHALVTRYYLSLSTLHPQHARCTPCLEISRTPNSCVRHTYIRIIHHRIYLYGRQQFALKFSTRTTTRTTCL